MNFSICGLWFVGLATPVFSFSNFPLPIPYYLSLAKLITQGGVLSFKPGAVYLQVVTLVHPGPPWSSHLLPSIQLPLPLLRLRLSHFPLCLKLHKFKMGFISSTIKSTFPSKLLLSVRLLEDDLLKRY